MPYGIVLHKRDCFNEIKNILHYKTYFRLILNLMSLIYPWMWCGWILNTQMGRSISHGTDGNSQVLFSFYLDNLNLFGDSISVKTSKPIWLKMFWGTQHDHMTICDLTEGLWKSELKEAKVHQLFHDERRKCLNWRRQFLN